MTDMPVLDASDCAETRISGKPQALTWSSDVSQAVVGKHSVIHGRSDPTLSETGNYIAGSSELPDDTAEVSTTTQNSRIFALVIAIDNYQDHRVRNLRGCVADGEDFSMFLRDTLHVPEDRIVTLYDDNASREGIINAFLGEQGLIHSSNIVKEEPIVIFYAGHGTRGCAPRSWGAEDNQFEGLCPCDITQPVMERPPQEKGTQTDDCRMVYAIPDRTFNSLMQHLAHEKGDNILVIMDCCHSGGMMRDGPTKEARCMCVDLDHPIPEDLDKKIWSWDVLNNPRAAAMAPLLGFANEAIRSHVLLAACQPKEKALEGKVPRMDVIRGFFTVNLVEFLRRTITDTHAWRELTYSRLLHSTIRISPSIAPLSHQNPLCMGPHPDRLLFSTHILPKSARIYNMQVENGTDLRVCAGEIHGVTLDTTFIMRDPDGATKMFPNGVPLYVKTVDPLKCSVNIVPEYKSKLSDTTEASISPNAQAEVGAWNRRNLTMKLYTTLSMSSLAQFTADYTYVKEKEYRDVSIEANNNQWLISHYDPLTLRFGDPNEIVDMASDVQYTSDEVADTVAHWLFHLYHFHTPSESRNSLLPSIALLRLKEIPKDHITGLVPVSQDPVDNLFHNVKATKFNVYPLSTYKVCGDVKEARTMNKDFRYGITLYNDSDVDLFPYVFYFDPFLFSITALYLPDSKQLVKGPLPKFDQVTGTAGELAIGHSSDRHCVNFSLREDGKRDFGFLKVFVSTENVDMSGIIQVGLNKKGKRAVTVVPFEGSIVTMWASAVSVLTIGME